MGAEASGVTVTIPSAEYVGVLDRQPVVQINEPYGIRLVDSPIHVLKADIDESTAEYHAVFEHPPFKAESLEGLLRIASPNRSGRIGDILADWDLPDRLPNSDRLEHHTSALGQHWIDFEASRYLYMQALAVGHTTYSSSSRNALRVNFVTREHIEARFHNLMPRVDFYEGRRIYKSEKLPSFVGMVASYIREDGLASGRDVSRMAASKTDKITAQLFRKQAGNYARRYYSSLTAEQLSLALDRYITINYEPFIDDEGQLKFLGKGAGLTAQTLKDAYDRRGTEELDGGRFDADISYVVTKRGIRQVIFPGTVREGARNVGIQPVLIWQTKTTDSDVHRELLVDAHPVEEVDRPDRHVYPSVLGGLLCVSYLSPQVRSAWKKTMRIPGEKNTQELGAAQIPVLALMKRRQLLDSALVRAIERFAA